VLAPSTTVTSRYLSLRFVPLAKGRYTRPPVSDWLATEDPGGNWKAKPYLAFRNVFQPALVELVAVGVGVDVAGTGV